MGASYQTNPIRLVRANVMYNVPVLHQLRNHGERSGFGVYVDGEEFQNIGVGSMHPKHGLLAKILYPEFHASWRKLDRALTTVPTF